MPPSIGTRACELIRLAGNKHNFIKNYVNNSRNLRTPSNCSTLQHKALKERLASSTNTAAHGGKFGSPHSLFNQTPTHRSAMPGDRNLTIVYAGAASLAAITLVYVFSPSFAIDSHNTSSSQRQKGVVGLVNTGNDCFVGVQV